MQTADIQQLTAGLSRHRQQDMPTVRDIMSKDCHTLDKSENVETARNMMLSKDIDFVILTEEGKPAGIFSIRDYISGLAKFKKDLVKQNVENLMSASIVTMNPDMNILEANDFMIIKGYRRYPVIVNDTLIGYITREVLFSEVMSYLQMKARRYFS